MSKFEQYNIDGLYGSDILSLANLREEYNLMHNLETGYTPIEIKVELKTTISVGSDNFFEAGERDISEILVKKRGLEGEIKGYEDISTKSYKNRTVKYFSQKSYKEIAQIYGVDYSSYTEEDVRDELMNHGTNELKNLVKDIERYKLLKDAYTEFKTKEFNCTGIVYDPNNGMITELYYEDQTETSVI